MFLTMHAHMTKADWGLTVIGREPSIINCFLLLNGWTSNNVSVHFVHDLFSLNTILFCYIENHQPPLCVETIFGSPFAIYGKYGEPMDCTLFWNVKIYVHFICILCLLNFCLKFYNKSVEQVLSYFVTFFDILNFQCV